MEARRRGDRLNLHYFLEGNVAKLILPPLQMAARGDRLWRHTCFEAFVRAGDAEGYTELNFAPSGRWAAYEFSGTRAGMIDADFDQPRIDIWSDHTALHLDAEIGGLAQAEIWLLGLSAVIEEGSGQMSYWALAHPSAKPDFHHPGSFVLVLP